MRADAQRNQERVLLAARDLVVERGPDVPLDEVARRAGVGIATLYRRFPDRRSLLEAVALDALDATTTVARRVREEEADPFAALAMYLREALELRVSAVMPAVLDVLELSTGELQRAREESAQAVEALVDRAHAAGALADDITFADIGTMLVRLARPLPGPMSAEAKHDLARRHLALFLRCLPPSAPAVDDGLPGPALSRAGLHELTEEE